MGYNYRLSNVLAAIGRGQLRVLPKRIASRRRNCEFYKEAIGRLTPLVWLGLFWAIVLSSVGGWMVRAWVNHVRGIARSAPLMYLPPPIAGIVAWLTLGEHFTWLKIAGAGITMAGIAWAQFGGGRPPPREAAQPDSG